MRRDDERTAARDVSVPMRRKGTRTTPRTKGAEPPGGCTCGRTGCAPARLVVESPIGPLVLAGDHDALIHVWLPGSAVPIGTDGPLPAPLVAAAHQLDAYFSGSRRSFSLPLAPRGTDFQLSVWRALGEIGYAETISYAALARRVGRPAASRAVGQACGANPLPIVYPCHRVVASDGTLGGYGGGSDMKRRLLALEGSRGATAR